MANVKISDLIAYADPSRLDILPIVDLVNDITKKVTIEDLLKNAGDGTAAAPAFAFNSDSNTGIYRSAADELAITTAGTQRVTVDSSGLVNVTGGIQVTENVTPTNGSGVEIFKASSTSGQLQAFNRSGSTWMDLILKGNTQQFHTNGSERIRIDSSGNVGIGTDSPAKALEILRDSFPCLMLNDGGQYKSYMQLGGNDLEIRGSSGTIEFYTGAADGLSSTERMRIDSSGRLLVGSSSGSYDLEVKKSGNVNLLVGSTNANGVALILDGDSNGDGSGADYADITHTTAGNLQYRNLKSGVHIFQGTSSSESMRIDSSGRLLLGTTTEGYVDADDLTIANSGHCGMTIRSGASNQARILFSDATSGIGEYSGYILFDHPTNAFIIGTSSTDALRIDSSGNVGIGTSSPAKLLHVSGSGTQAIRLENTSSSPGNANLELKLTSNTFTIGLNPTTNYFQDTAGRDYIWYQGGNERMRIDGSGRVLIGTATEGYVSADDLTIASTGSTGMTIRSGTSNYGSIFFSDAVSGSGEYAGAIEYNHAANSFGFYTNSAERMRINSSGNIGIGTSSPIAKLDVRGTAYIGTSLGIDISNPGDYHASANDLVMNGGMTLANASQGSIFFADSSTGTGEYVGQLNYYHSSDSMAFVTNNGERMRIDSTGRMLVGTTTEGYDNAADNLTIADSGNCGMTVRSGSSSMGSIYFSDGTSGNAEYRGYIDYNHSADALRIATGASVRMQIDNTGRVGIGNASPTTKLEVAGDVKVVNTGIAYLQPNTVTAFQAYESSGPVKINLNNNGSATFVDKVTAADFDSNHPSDGRFGRFNWAGIRFTDTSGNNVIRLDADGGGSATFASTIEVQDGVSGVTTSANDVLTVEASDVTSKTRGIGIYGKSSITSTYEAFQLRHGGNQNLTIKYDGSITASADASINGLTVGRGAGNVSSNTAVGSSALNNNSTGTHGTAIGIFALRANSTGSHNIATGNYALYHNTTANYNTAYGYQALYSNTTGETNVANGYAALYSNTTGSGNIGIGFLTNTGNYAPVFNPTTESNRLVLGHTSITNAYVQVAWTVTSDERDKMNFAPVPYGLDFVNQLKPTAYQFKVDRDTEEPSGDVRYGFKAQDILALEGDNPVIIDTEDADHLKYKGEHLVPVLVNAVQELTAMVKELQDEVAALKSA